MRKHPKADIYVMERQKGKTLRQIAEEQGVSPQAVSQSLHTHAPTIFKPYTEEKCVYPNWRKWLNNNKVTRKEFMAMMGLVPCAQNLQRLSVYMLGKKYPQKETIDRLLKTTGLTYEEFFQRDSGDD